MDFDLFGYDFRRFETEHAVSSLQRYLQIMDVQMQEAYRFEREAMNKKGPESDHEEDREIWRQEQDALQNLFEDQLRPAMYYSFITLVHTIFETRLKAFCADNKKQQNSLIDSTDFKGSPIEQARKYLTKVCGFDVQKRQEWQRLLKFQRVRDCIVHTNGELTESRDEKEIRLLIAERIGLEISDFGRLVVTKPFCDEYLSCLDRFFRGLFDDAGWGSGLVKNERPDG